MCTTIKVQGNRERKRTESLHLCGRPLLRPRKVGGLEGEGRLEDTVKVFQKVCRPGRFDYYPSSTGEETEAWKSHSYWVAESSLLIQVVSLQSSCAITLSCLLSHYMKEQLQKAQGGQGGKSRFPEDTC